MPKPLQRPYTYSSFPHVVNRRTPGTRLEPIKRVSTPIVAQEKKKKFLRKRKVRKKKYSDQNLDLKNHFKRMLNETTETTKEQVVLEYESDFEDEERMQLKCPDHTKETTVGRHLLTFSPYPLSVIKEEKEEESFESDGVVNKLFSLSNNWRSKEPDNFEWAHQVDKVEVEKWERILHPYVYPLVQRTISESLKETFDEENLLISTSFK